MATPGEAAELLNNRSAAEEANAPGPVAAITPKIESSSYRIKSKEEIFGYLQKLYKNHTLLSINIEGSSIKFGSIILEIDKKSSYLILDEIFPRNNISKNILNKRLTMESRIDGIYCKYSSVVESSINEDNSEYPKLSIPSSMYYFQRREYFRARSSAQHPVQIELFPQNGEKIQAQMNDLSIGGLSAKINDQSLNINSKVECPECVIIFPDGEKITSHVEIIRMDETKDKNIVLAGKFQDLESKNRDILSREIAILERENIKIVKRNDDR